MQCTYTGLAKAHSTTKLELFQIYPRFHQFRLEEKESMRLLNMEETLSKQVVGQMEAITILAKAIRRARAGLGATDARAKNKIAAPMTGALSFCTACFISRTPLML